MCGVANTPAGCGRISHVQMLHLRASFHIFAPTRLHARQTSTIVPAAILLLTSQPSSNPVGTTRTNKYKARNQYNAILTERRPPKLSALFCRRRCGKSGYTVPNLSPIHPTVLRSRCADPHAISARFPPVRARWACPNDVRHTSLHRVG